MNRLLWSVLAVVLLAGNALASDPIGVYAVVDKVVLEPKDGPAERIQVWGAFSIAKGRSGSEYGDPVRGYLYFGLLKNQEDLCRREWADLGKVAGTGQCIGFGTRYKDSGTVRKASEEPKTPDVYQLGFGMQKVGNDYPLVLRLHELPNPLEPNDGDLVPKGPITLRIRNNATSVGSKARYYFVIDDGSGNQEASGPIAAGQKETSWSPKMTLKGGGKYTWRVWTKEGDKEDKSLAITLTIKVKG